MLCKHRMFLRTYADLYLVSLDRNDRDMLFTARFNGIGCELLHLFAATEYGYTRTFDHSDNVAAMTADIKFVGHIFLLSVYLRGISRGFHFARFTPQSVAHALSNSDFAMLEYKR